MTEINIQSSRREELIDITPQIKEKLSALRAGKGRLLVFVPHTTAAVIINEGADPSVAEDLLKFLNDLVPRDATFYRHTEGNSDAHIKASFLGCSELIPVEKGSPQLGTWQSVFFAEFDGPRRRRVYLSLTE